MTTRSSRPLPFVLPSLENKTDDQALKWMRDLCLALPDTSEGIHYGEIVFKVGKKMFASCGDKRGPRTIVFRIDPKRTGQLVAKDPRFQRYSFEKSALVIKASDVDDWDQLRAFVEESYRREAEAPQTKPGTKKLATKSKKPSTKAKPRRAS